MCGYRKYGPVYIVWFNPEPIDINCFINVNTISLWNTDQVTFSAIF